MYRRIIISGITHAMGAICLLLLAACQPRGEASMSGAPSSITEFQIIDTVVGDGATAEAGQTVDVHYTGWLYDTSGPENKGPKFDSSVDRGDPFSFLLGKGQVIAGWDNGVAGMRVGGQRVLLIPPEMGYGSRGAGGVIPPNATLLFEVELLDVK